MFSRIVLIYKKTLLDIFKEKEYDNILNKPKYPLLKQIKEAHVNHEKSIEIVKKTLNKINIPTLIYQRGSGRMPILKEDDLLVSLGGDGTFIFSSHHCKNTKVLGLNSAPLSSIGHYCHPIYPNDKEKLLKLLENILSGAEKPKTIERLDFFINNQFCGIPVLNDVLVSEKSPCTTTRYMLEFNDKSYSQKSSGIWIATATGSSAAFQSAGGKVFTEKSKTKQKQYGFQVRELYKKTKDSMTGALVNEKDHFKIISGMATGFIFLDGSHRFFPFTFGEELTIKFSKYPLFVYR
ncbi:MAG: hypothetical protein OEZ13_01865 [Spirochaetia bacterium]|nr:hypothetical protein [Spirochaetia bacterium]